MLTDQFLIDLKQKYIDTICTFNQDKTVETRQWDFPTKVGNVEVNVMRGKVFEKACVSSIFATVTIPGRDYESTIQWLGVQTFPSNPLAPLLMGVYEHVSEIGKEHTPGYYDIYPVVPFDEDKAYALKEMKAVSKNYTRIEKNVLFVFADIDLVPGRRNIETTGCKWYKPLALPLVVGHLKTIEKFEIRLP